ncbi:hypothetical protein JOF57_002279 [Mycolicibacterium lutetiense]|uniref:Uncharacterized protein n=1 Tax=Mycolicibacterium lutetiense TaxID=1641992 RepID=A0ABS4ZT73_9MYCO|nr:hypothetical protein [Mycolicibacterium lutetiense]MBP2452366.1 hypothetical protein [Mycolicibacterium lutetiense]
MAEQVDPDDVSAVFEDAGELVGGAERIDEYGGVEGVIAQRQSSGVTADAKAGAAGCLGEHGDGQVYREDLVEVVG